ncbi:TetR/AcrR family transcriptional regulator [Pseudomonas sp. Z3-6]|uniref:TetR/AcrR family transcriptional regulator n=1 Tax=Pseudomonas sp. Z3-6 TaxID=2817411 RepID=UPI003DAA4A29
MKVSREKAKENHERVVDTAAAMLREHGYDGIGIADMMKAAGLTQGGFYRNFTSKDDLIVKATEHALEATRAMLQEKIASAPEMAFKIVIEQYLSCEHRDGTASGCVLPALAADSARRDDPALRSVFVDAIDGYLQSLNAIAPTMPEGSRSRAPAAILAEMVGAVVLARALGEGDRANNLLKAVTRDLLEAP